MRRPEQALHVQVARFLELATKPPTLWSTFPSGGGGKTRGALLKRMGLKAGMPDIVVFHPQNGLSRLIGIELKAGKGIQSKPQKAMAVAWEAAGGTYLICRSVDDVEIMLAACGVPLYARSIRSLN